MHCLFGISGYNETIKPNSDLVQCYFDAFMAPSDEGKRSAVAVVNDSPVDCQSRDWIARRRLSAMP